MAIKSDGDEEKIYGDDSRLNDHLIVLSQSERKAGFIKIEPIKSNLKLSIHDYEEARKYLKSKC